jgi:hypothetical protein
MNETNATIYSLDVLFGNNPSKYFCIAFSFVSVPFVVLLLYSIIWYEHFGIDAKQTLINKFLSSACWTCLQFIVFVQIPDLGRYLIGPFPESVCLFQFVMKNTTSLQILIFFDGIIVARYFYVFRLKNPAAFQDEFWHRFLNIWTASFSFISQSAFVYLPGRQPLNYYICTGKISSEDLETPLKINRILGLTGVTSVLVHIVIAAKIYRFKHKVGITEEDLVVESCGRRSNFVKSLEKQSLTDMTTTLFNFIGVAATVTLLSKMYSINPVEVNLYPNYLYVYLLHLVSPLVSMLTLSILYYARNASMRRTMFREAKGFLNFQTKRDENW